MQLNRFISIHCGTAKSSMAAGLALLLLIAATFSSSHLLHRVLHPEDSADHLCLVCSLVKGQVSVADAVCVAVVLLFCSVPAALLALPAPPLPSDYRLSPSRAPPRR